MQFIRYALRLIGSVAAAAVLTTAVPLAAPAAADGVAPRPVTVKRCTFSGRTPAPNSVVTTRDVFIAVTVTCNKPVGRVAVFLDGVRRTTEGLGPDVFTTNEFFEALDLSAGQHRVRVTVAGNGSTTWVFTVR